MPKPEFDIVIEKNLVEVRHDVSSKSPRGRFYAGLFFVALIVGGACLVLFLPGKNSKPSMWHDISVSPAGSTDLVVPVCLLFLYLAAMGPIVFRYLFAAFPADEVMRCDSTTLTISKVAWFYTSNSKWRTREFPLSEVTELRYGVIASAKQTSIRGIRFRVWGKRQKMLPGLEAPEAAAVLKAMGEMVARVVDDPELETKAKKYSRTGPCSGHGHDKGGPS